MNLSFFLALLLLFVGFSYGKPSTDLDSLKNSTGGARVVGGENATPHEYPWIIRIQSEIGKSLTCGGAIIDHDLILTAAHCIENPDSVIKNYEVVAGAHDMSLRETTRQTKSITKIKCHQSYNGQTYENDICLLKLKSGFSWSSAVQPVPLATDSMNIGVEVIVAGWGTTAEAGNVAQVLQKVHVPTVSNQVCGTAYSSVFNIKITDSMMCAGVAGKDSCQGDSGGPLICSNPQNGKFVCGIVSFGIGCGRPGYPGVYTRVSSYRNWIAENSSNSLFLSSAIMFFSTFFLTLN